MINVIVYPTQVQGAAAAAQIVNAIFIANRRREVDVLIVGRGGGSLEDLWCFNEETVARAIFGSHLPIVSAVGHEVDVTIADFVADLRAATPSQAAELVSSDLGDVIYTIEQWRQRLTQAISTKLNECDYQQQLLGSRLQQNHPQQRLQQQAQAIDHFTMQLQHNMQHRLQVAQQRQQHLENRLQHLSPIHLVSQSQQHTYTLTERLRQAMANRLTHQQQRFAKVTGILHSVSPLATLSRGYSISFVDNHVVNTTSTIKEGDTLTTRLTDGEVTSKVERISAVK
jgi:exodeoxyribonuclease VII large subunit